MIAEKPKVLSEFKKFISRGNVVDLAVGIIIGSSFTAIVNSLVKDIIMPPIGLLLGKVNFADLRLILQAQSTTGNGKVIPEVAIMYGSFIQVIFNFLLIALVVFLMVKVISLLQKEETPAGKPKETELAVLKDIRKLLKRRKATK